MPLLGITGGIATGKSTFVTHFLPALPTVEFFDADRAAHDLLAHDSGVAEAIIAAFGPAIYPTPGVPDRAALRDFVFADPAKRAVLEGILHPAIRKAWQSRADTLRETNGWFVVDIPLLYETKAEGYFDRVIVVACSPVTQRERLHHARGLSAQQAEQILSAQLPLDQKIANADHLIWNNANLACLTRQATILAGYLRQRYA